MKTKVIAKSIIFNQKNEVLLLLRGKTAPRRPLQWDLPGGFVEDQEHVVEAAARETKEETGITVSIHNLHLVYSLTKLWDEGSSVHLYYGAKIKNPIVKISWEHDEFCWVSIDEACELIVYEPQKNALQYIKENDIQI